MKPKPAALGVRVHSGWATVIALSASQQVIARERIELANPTFPGSHEPFHFVELMSLSEASAIIARCWKSSMEIAVDALAQHKQLLKQKGYDPRLCAILQGRITEMPDLEKILAAYPNFYQMAHTAGGVMFREIVMIAAEANGMRVTRIAEHNIEEKAPGLLGIAPHDLSDRLTSMGGSLGPPWTIDQKLAACVAWLALAAKRK